MNYIELMKSRTVLAPIIDSIDFDTEKKPTAKEFAKSTLDIKNTKGTNLIEVTARGKSPEEAQRISQTVVDNFLLMQTDMNQQTQSLLMKFLDERIHSTKDEMEKSEDNLAQFSREHKVYSPTDQAKAVIEQMASYDKEIGKAEVEAASAQASLSAANEKLGENRAAARRTISLITELYREYGIRSSASASSSPDSSRTTQSCIRASRRRRRNWSSCVQASMLRSSLVSTQGRRR